MERAQLRQVECMPGRLASFARELTYDVLVRDVVSSSVAQIVADCWQLIKLAAKHNVRLSNRNSILAVLSALEMGADNCN